jgi:DNA-binding winged helix-turn-helix (wHTH) protein
MAEAKAGPPRLAVRPWGKGDSKVETYGFTALRIGDCSVRPSLNLIEQAGCSILLQPQSMDVLVYLAERAGDVVSSDELLDAIWPNRVVGDDAVHRRIAYLRKQLRDDARHPRYIQTVPKRGYRLVAEVVPIAGTMVEPGPRQPMDIARLRRLMATVEMLSDEIRLLLGHLHDGSAGRQSAGGP